MRRMFFSLCALAALDLLPLYAQETGARLAFDSITVDLGKVPDGEPLHHVFKFTNVGGSTLEMREIQASCGCMSTLLTAKTIEPGQGGQLDVKVTTADVTASSRSLAQTVSILKTVTVTTNDRKQPSVILVVKAVIVPEMVSSESGIFFGSHARGEEIIKEVFVEITPDKPIRLTGASSTDDGVTARLESVPGSGDKKIKVVATLKATASEGQHQGFVLVNTSSPLKPQLKIPVRATVTKSDVQPSLRCAQVPEVSSGTIVSAPELSAFLLPAVRQGSKSSPGMTACWRLSGDKEPPARQRQLNRLTADTIAYGHFYSDQNECFLICT